MQLGDQQFQFPIHDRDSKLSSAYDDVFRSDDIKVIRTPVQGADGQAGRRSTVSWA